MLVMEGRPDIDDGPMNGHFQRDARSETHLEVKGLTETSWVAQNTYVIQLNLGWH